MFDQIYRIVKEETGITREQMREDGRRRNIVKGKALFVVIARQYMNISYTLIARELLRDHTSIIHLYNSRKDSEYIQEVIKKYKNNLDEINSKSISDGMRLRFLNLTPRKKTYQEAYQKYGGKCAVCSFDEVVEIHHIQPRYLNGTDDLENLILLCPNHHALADRGMVNIKGKLELMHNNLSYPHN